MSDRARDGRQRVAVVTGGGSGIGAAIAEQLGREGWFVATVDPLVTVDGAERLPEPQETTAGRIVASGGSAVASSASVTDGEAIRSLFDGLVAEHGGLDAVVNVGGISRPTGFAFGSEEDWRAVLTVHLDGYLNVLGAALPHMAAAGHGHIVGVTSGSGWRAGDAGAYSCAKRAVAALTWQLGRHMPPGVTVNALSPIAATRMVAGAMQRAGRQGSSSPSRTGAGLSLLDSMPAAADLGPIGAFLASEEFSWCNGRVIFAGGSEVSLVEEPRLLEVARTEGAASCARVLDAVVPRAFVPAEAGQATAGGGNPRFADIFSEPGEAPPGAGPVKVCGIVSDRPDLASSLTASLGRRSVTCHRVEAQHGFAAAADALRRSAESFGPLDAVVVAMSASAPAPGAEAGWKRILAEHRGLIDRIHTDGGWARATADYAEAADRQVRLVTLTDATTSAGRSRAQASAQLARAALGSTKGRVTALSAAIEGRGGEAVSSVTELVARLLTDPEAGGLAGAELVVHDAWIGLRSHPRPIGTIIYGGPALPGWMNDALRQVVDGSSPVEEV